MRSYCQLLGSGGRHPRDQSAGIAVHAFNQRDIPDILAMIRTLGALVGATEKAEALAQRYERRLTDVGCRGVEQFAAKGLF